jgi:hypothetical protein
VLKHIRLRQAVEDHDQPRAERLGSLPGDSRRTGQDGQQLAAEIEQRRIGNNLSAAIRVYIIDYYRAVISGGGAEGVLTEPGSAENRVRRKGAAAGLVLYSTACTATTIAIRTAQESAERPAITTAACARGRRPSISLGRPGLVRLWSARWKVDIIASGAKSCRIRSQSQFNSKIVPGK